jgi:hypothetical protein
MRDTSLSTQPDESQPSARERQLSGTFIPGHSSTAQTPAPALFNGFACQSSRCVLAIGFRPAARESIALPPSLSLGYAAGKIFTGGHGKACATTTTRVQIEPSHCATALHVAIALDLIFVLSHFCGFRFSGD